MNQLIYFTFLFQKHQGNLFFVVFVVGGGVGFFFFLFLHICILLSPVASADLYNLFFERASLKNYSIYPEN